MGRSRAEALLVFAGLLAFIVPVWIGAHPVAAKTGPISTGAPQGLCYRAAGIPRWGERGWIAM
jgi:hypothetical protein